MCKWKNTGGAGRKLYESEKKETEVTVSFLNKSYVLGVIHIVRTVGKKRIFAYEGSFKSSTYACAKQNKHNFH